MTSQNLFAQEKQEMLVCTKGMQINRLQGVQIKSFKLQEKN